MRMLIALAASAVISVVSEPASADLYNFVLSGTDGITSEGAVFQIDTSTAPDYYTLDDYAQYNAVQGSFFHESQTDTFGDITFYSASNDGGIFYQGSNNRADYGVTDGPQLYIGPESQPTGFTTGTYQLTDYYTKAGGAQITITDLSLTTQTGALPELSTWAMLIGGAGIIGASMRRKRSVAVRLAA